MPVSSAAIVYSERWFSAVRRVKSYPRSRTMGDERISNLSVLRIHRHLYVVVDESITDFIGRKTIDFTLKKCIIDMQACVWSWIWQLFIKDHKSSEILDLFNKFLPNELKDSFKKVKNRFHWPPVGLKPKIVQTSFCRTLCMVITLATTLWRVCWKAKCLSLSNKPSFFQ